MRDTAAPPPRLARAEPHHAAWVSLGWKALLVVALLLLMSVDSPLSWALAWAFLNPIQPTLLIWGAILVIVACANLLEGDLLLRWAWGGLTLGAYLTLSVPGVLMGAPRLLEALAPVAALTLAAHLGRHDLPRALRDWALVIGIALYVALGVQAMWLLVSAFGVGVFLIAALLPPLVFDALLIVLRFAHIRRESVRDALGLLLATAISLGVISFTQFNRSMPLFWSVVFHLAVGLIVGGALLVALLTRPLIEVASGAHAGQSRGLRLARTLVEFSHGPILISLALYIPLRLFEIAR